MVSKTLKKKKTIESVFTINDYNSNDGMLTSVWGPGMWHYLHSMSFNYPINPTHDDKIHYRQFILSLRNVLPCGKCRKNLKNNFKILPLRMKDMKNRDSFSRYVYNLHEVINHMLGKESGLKFEQVRERYEHFRARCAKTLKKKVRFVDESSLDKSEIGCSEPLYGEKAKCVLHIVPHTSDSDSLVIDDKCVKKRIVMPPSIPLSPEK